MIEGESGLLAFVANGIVRTTSRRKGASRFKNGAVRHGLFGRRRRQIRGPQHDAA